MTSLNVSTIPSVNLVAQYHSIRSEVDAALSRVLEDGEFERGDELWAFEDEFARFCQVTHAIGVGSGYAALFLALRALGIGPGDEVITVPNTDIATCSAISHCGASIVWADVEAETFNINPECVEALIGPRTKAVIAVHLYGLPADLIRLLEIVEPLGIPIIEDAALACGARLHGRRVGGIGTFGCFSFAPHKILGAYGDGGMVTTNDPALAERVRLLAGYGEGGREGMTDGDGRFHLYAEGYHNHLDLLQAAILRVKLPHVDAWISARRARASLYNDLLGSSPHITVPKVPPDFEHAYRGYTIRLPHRDHVHRYLVEQGISAGINYVPPLHLQAAYRERGMERGAFPIVESLADTLLCLPIYPELSNDEVCRVAAAVLQAMENL